MENTKTNSTPYMRNAILLSILAIVMLLIMTGTAQAASESDEMFGELFKTVANYMKGTLGALIALSAILCGSFIAVKTQSFWGFIMGVVIAVGLYYAPTIINGLMDDTLTDSAAVVVENNNAAQCSCAEVKTCGCNDVKSCGCNK